MKIEYVGGPLCGTGEKNVSAQFRELRMPAEWGEAHYTCHHVGIEGMLPQAQCARFLTRGVVPFLWRVPK